MQGRRFDINDRPFVPNNPGLYGVDDEKFLYRIAHEILYHVMVEKKGEEDTLEDTMEDLISLQNDQHTARSRNTTNSILAIPGIREQIERRMDIVANDAYTTIMEEYPELITGMTLDEAKKTALEFAVDNEGADAFVSLDDDQVDSVVRAYEGYKHVQDYWDDDDYDDDDYDNDDDNPSEPWTPPSANLSLQEAVEDYTRTQPDVQQVSQRNLEYRGLPQEPSYHPRRGRGGQDMRGR